MKKLQLKELIKQIIKEALTEQPVGGIKNDHPFDAGRQNVMKAVNVGEMIGTDGRYQDNMESGAAVKKLHNLNEEIPATGVSSIESILSVLEAVTANIGGDDVIGKLSREQLVYKLTKIRSVLNGLVINIRRQNNKGMEEQIVGDMLPYIPKFKPGTKMYSGKDITFFSDIPVGSPFKFGTGKLNDDAFLKVDNKTFKNIKTGETGSIGSDLRATVVGMANEQTCTGAVAGYATPYAFSKKKSGSQRALDVTKKMGFTKVKDISEDIK